MRRHLPLPAPLVPTLLALALALAGCSGSGGGSTGSVAEPDAAGTPGPDGEGGPGASTDSDADGEGEASAPTDTGAGDGTGTDTPAVDPDDAPDTTVVEPAAPAADFFVTSAGIGDGGNLGGLAGADAHCTALAEAAGVSGRQWRAYLSTDGADGTDAIDRIGQGPWFNLAGVKVADGPEDLLSESVNLNKATALSERGETINGSGDRPNRHDILTGTGLDGRASGATCLNWTSNAAGSATVGHHDRNGGGANATSWSSAHETFGPNACSLESMRVAGGDGLFYCFAIN